MINDLSITLFIDDFALLLNKTTIHQITLEFQISVLMGINVQGGIGKNKKRTGGNKHMGTWEDLPVKYS